MDENRVLISDVIPAGTVLNVAPAPAGVPPGSAAVYSTDDPVLTGTPSYKVNWSITTPTTAAELSAVKRIGFIYTKDTPVTASASVITGFNFTVKFTAAIQQGTQIANLAQVFGRKAIVAAGTGAVPDIFDESGDADYNNDSNNDGVADILPNNTTGIANPGTQGVDTKGDNSGTGLGGEDNVYTVGITAAGVLNGTVTTASGVSTPHPDAVGPTSNNDDFTNRSSAVAPNKVPLVTFSNSIQNTSGAAANLSLIPQAVDLKGLPVGTTIITIGDTNGTKVTYTVIQSTSNGTPSITASGNPLTFSNVAASEIKQYEVTVDLPENTPQNKGYDVPITAFVDGNANNVPDGSEAQNKTIDRVYAGFLSLLKETQVLGADGTTVKEAFSISPKKAAPGETIEYRIKYQNISEVTPTGTAAATGTTTGSQFNVVLTGNNIKITEDGTSGGNNWAIDQNGDNIIDTSHVQGTTDTKSGTLTYYNGLIDAGSNPVTNTPVTKYVDTISTPLPPQDSGLFTFKRKLN